MKCVLLLLSALGILLMTNIRACAAPPNVIIIISDDHGWTDYSFMGHPHVRTPHIDKLASQGRGIRFIARRQSVPPPYFLS